jgi:glycosyltransferase involved in cell wall biosynthesis
VRICIVTVAGHDIGGMQDHTRSLAKGLVAAGHEVEIVTTRHPQGLLDEERDGARWHYTDAAHHHPWLPRRDPGWLPRSYEAFNSLHGERPFDVIHSESASAIGLVRRGVHRYVPLVAKYHGNGLALAGAALARARAGDGRVKVREAKGLVWLLGEWLQYGHWYRFRPCTWIVPSRREFEDTRRSALLKGALGHIVPNGVDVKLFRPRPREQVRTELRLHDGPIFVSAGRLNIEKGMHYAVRALAAVGDDMPRGTLVIVGDGEERGPLEQLASSLVLGQRVIFAGAQPHEVVAKYLAAADLFLFPTERAEAAPVVLPQAMACAAPVIASDIGGIPEVVQRSGANGLLVPPGDVPALADAMRALVRDESLRHRLGQAARQRVLVHYTVERMVEQTLEVYRIAIARLRQQRPDQGSPRPPAGTSAIRLE